jgi:hypothetical protein
MSNIEQSFDTTQMTITPLSAATVSSATNASISPRSFVKKNSSTVTFQGPYIHIPCKVSYLSSPEVHRMEQSQK